VHHRIETAVDSGVQHLPRAVHIDLSMSSASAAFRLNTLAACRSASTSQNARRTDSESKTSPSTNADVLRIDSHGDGR